MEVVLIVTKGILKEVKDISVWYEMQFWISEWEGCLGSRTCVAIVQGVCQGKT